MAPPHEKPSYSAVKYNLISDYGCQCQSNRKKSNMTEHELTCISRSNNRLPDNAYFSYGGIEIIEFHIYKNNVPSIETVTGRRITLSEIDTKVISLQFDD